MNIGGTLSDVRRMPYADVMAYHAYARRHGGLPLQRLAHLVACLCVMFNNAHQGKATLRDFLPDLPAPESETIDSADAFLSALGR